MSHPTRNVLTGVVSIVAAGIMVAVVGGCDSARETSRSPSAGTGIQTFDPGPARSAQSASGGFHAIGGGAAAAGSRLNGVPSSAPPPPMAVGGHMDYMRARPQAQIAAPKTKLASVRVPEDAAKAVYNPNVYVTSTYLGGSGERDRVEKLVREGVLVDGKRVKLEAFSRNYAQAFTIPTKQALSLAVDTERSRIIQSGDHTFLQVGLQAQKGEAPRRPPLNVVLVIDRSGSMGSEGKMEQAKLAAARMVDGLTGHDSFALVAFDDSANLLVPSEPVQDRAALRRQIESLAPGGGTNIYDGLEIAYREVTKHATADTVNRVLLLSDGDVTAGTQDPAAFRTLAGENAARDIQTTTIGLGVQYNEELMLGLAQEGRGNYHFIKDAADAKAVFAKEMDELTHSVAVAVRLRIQLADGVGLVRILGSRQLTGAETQQAKTEEKRIDRKAYEELGIRTDRQKQKDEPGIKMLIPNFYRGDSHVVMLELVVPPGSGSRKLADVFLKYKDLARRGNQSVQASASIRYTPNRSEMIASVNRTVKKNLLGFQTGEALSQAAALIGEGRVADAVKLVDERMVVLGLAAKEWQDRDLDRDGRLLDRYKTVLSELGQNRQLASAELGQYVRKSLTYSGYELTR